MNVPACSRARERGVALVEFALVLPLLLVLSLVTVELGRGLYQYNLITKSVRDASRYLSMHTPNTRLTEARNLVVHGNTAGTGPPLAAGLAAVHVIDPVWQTSGTLPVVSTVTVEVRGYVFQSLFAGAFGLPLGNITFGGIQATMRCLT